MKCKVQFFKPSGKYYTEEEIELPADAMPWRLEPFLPKDRLKDMLVYFSGDAPWGFPVLLRVGDQARAQERVEELRAALERHWCPKCQGKGYVVRGGGFGDSMPCECACHGAVLSPVAEVPEAAPPAVHPLVAEIDRLFREDPDLFHSIAHGVIDRMSPDQRTQLLSALGR